MTAPANRPVVVLTGAAGGIGSAAARRFARAGASLALCDVRSSDALEHALSDAQAAGGAGFFHEADLRDRDQAQALVERAEAEFGRVDVVVTAAGILRWASSDDVPWEMWDDVLAVNLTATWACIRAALPGMLERGSGRVITIASDIGQAGLPDYAAYGASKGAVISLTKCLAKELAPRGVLVNCVSPGGAETDMMINSPENTPEWLTAVPLGRWGDPDEIAGAIEFLAGPDATYFVGQVVAPNGGLVI